MLPEDYSKTPVCQHFGICGGCKFQGLDKKDYLKLKTDLVRAPMLHEGLSVDQLKDIILIPSQNRRRCTLKTSKFKDKILLGYHEMKSHSIVDIKECPLLTNELQSLINPLKACLKPILSGKGTYDVTIAQSESGFDVILDGFANLTTDQTIRLIAFARDNNIARIRLKYKNNFEPIITLNTPTLKLGGITVECDADGFMQASNLSDQILSELVMKQIPDSAKRGVDLFCGRGTFSLPLSAIIKVDAYDLEDRAINVLQKSAHKASRPVTAYVRNLFEEPLENKDLAKYDFLVINPPRAGALKQCKILAACKIPTIVMVSCDPKTFARDAKYIVDGGYQLKEITAVDQFIWSNHIEVIGVFSK